MEIKHIFIPKHIILSKKEAEELLKKYNIDKSQLPKIKLKDPALPKEAKVGDIIKIERKTEKGKVIFYRVVIP
ncbi:MAG: DNA-directed RNA polymerase subunit RpoH/Rpb5 C-terminal domain-containing protein [Candidatus Pacearchaeota archaeon]